MTSSPTQLEELNREMGRHGSHVVTIGEPFPRNSELYASLNSSQTHRSSCFTLLQFNNGWTNADGFFATFLLGRETHLAAAPSNTARRSSVQVPSKSSSMKKRSRPPCGKNKRTSKTRSGQASHHARSLKPRVSIGDKFIN